MENCLLRMFLCNTVHVGFPRCVGAIDCTHIPIKKPRTTPHIKIPGSFINRKGWFSINVQVKDISITNGGQFSITELHLIVPTITVILFTLGCM